MLILILIYARSFVLCNVNFSKIIEVFLRRHLPVPLVLIISTLCVHIVHHADCEQVKVTDGNAELYASEQKEGCCHLAVSWAKFFLDCTSVCTLSPHSSMSFGST